MARWRQGVELVAALGLTAGLATGCAMDEPGAKSDATHLDAIVRLAHDYVGAGDPVALLRSRGAVVTDEFAATGTYDFTLAGIAERGSQVSVRPVGKPAAWSESMRLDLPSSTTVSLARLEAVWGRATRLPAMKTVPFQYQLGGIGVVERRTGRVIAVMSGDPSLRSSRVRSLQIIREAA